MYSYQPLKADEVKFVLVGLFERLDACPRGSRDPVFMLECLKERVEDIANLYETEELVFRDPAFGMDGLNRLGVIMAYLSIIEEEYLPAVAHMTDEERDLRVIFLGSAKRLGLDWIKDVVVHSSGSLAIFPTFFSALDIPVIHVQANFLDRCLCLPGAFHEFGHSVFLKFSQFFDAMKAELAAHFDALRKVIGPVSEEQKKRQVESLNRAQDYWTDSRLAELFCDLFAQYVAGCANFISMVDLSMATGQPACDTGIPDYPPDAARVKVCEYALTPAQAASDEVKSLLAEWEKYAEIENADSVYREVCSEKLLQRFAAVILELLPQLMPQTQRNVAVMPDIESVLGPYENLTFEEATQRGITVLLKRPVYYDSWWREARRKIV
jgi:hypothetical protein